ncbi:MAG: ABC transporter permease [Planctomycetales bacterium]
MYKLLLCLRYLRTRYIALSCVLSVTLGVATMIVVNAVMAGFSTEMRNRIQGLLSDVMIESNNHDGTPNPEQQMAIIREIAGEHIDGMTATVEVYGMLSFQYAGQWITRPVTIIGIRPGEKSQVGPFVDYLDRYQTIKEEDVVVRQPFCERGVPPTWELTDEAREYRRRWISRQRFLLMNDDHLDDRDNPFPPASEEASIDPFTIQPRPAGAGDGIDPLEPLPATLYIGKQLVTFVVEDPHTGKHRTMKMVQPGDDVKISTITSGRPPNPVHFNATVADIFNSGMSEYDSSLVFCNLEYLQQARGMIDPGSGTRSITSVQIKLKSYDDAEEVVRRLRAAFPPGLYTVRTWEQKQGPLLAAVEVEKAILNVLLFLIIAVAGFGILAIFFMIVVEKTRDIGILKALGAGSGGVMTIFLSYGLALGIVGAGGGVTLGLLFVAYINDIERFLTWLTGRKVFDEAIYYFPSIPTSVEPFTVMWIAAGAMAIAVLSSILPARRAARLHPVEALRFE